MTDEIKAQRLAAWLSSPAGTPPPEDLDPEVLGAVWALAPDRAPAPRVSIDDIFASVTEGPFVVGTKVKLVAHSGGKLDASAVGDKAVGNKPVDRAGEEAGTQARGAAGPTAPSAQPANVVPMKRSGPSRAWMLPTICLALAAAAATLIVVPTVDKLSPADPSAQEEARDLGRLSARKERAADQEADREGGSVVAPDAAPPAPAPADAPAIAELAAEQEPPMPTTGSPKPTLGARRADPPPRYEPTQTKDQLAPLEAAPAGRTEAGFGTQSGESPLPSPPPPLAEVSSAPEATPRSREEDKAKTFIPESAGPASPREASDDSLLDGAVTEQEEHQRQAVDEVVVIQKTESARAASAKKGAGAKNDAGGSSSKEVAANERRSQVLSKAPAKYSSPSSAPSARAVAWPNDYDPSWYTVLPDVAPTFEAARADELAGRYEDALVRYRTLATDRRADVVQDASLRAAKVLRALGRNAEALAMVDSGLRRSSANTPVRSSLYALRGELLLLLGRAGEAESAWVEARNLNTGR